MDIEKVKVNPESIEDSFRVIKKKEQRPLKAKMLADYEDGLVVPVYEPQALSMIPVYLPFWITNDGKKLICAVNLTQRAKVDKKTKDISIYPKTLFGLMVAGTTMRAITMNEQSIMSSTKLLTLLSKVYANIFSKILDKEYAISANEVYLDQIRYLCAKFFLNSVLNRSSSMSTDSIAMKSVLVSSTSVVNQINAQFPAESYANMITFVDGLGRVFKRLKDLSYRSILSELVKQYSATSYLMLEYAPFFVANLVMALTSAGVNNEYSFETAMGKDGTAIYAELARLI